MKRGLPLVAAAVVVLPLSCAEPPRAPPARAGITAVELTSFEVRDNKVDRFEHCPPAGEIGQDWVPPIPEWHPPAASASAAVPEERGRRGGRRHADRPRATCAPRRRPRRSRC